MCLGRGERQEEDANPELLQIDPASPNKPTAKTGKRWKRRKKKVPLYFLRSIPQLVYFFLYIVLKYLKRQLYTQKKRIFIIKEKGENSYIYNKVLDITI